MNSKQRVAAPVIIAGAIAMAFPVTASATNGYIAHGIGIKAQGLAGAGIALPQDALAAATNPAGSAFVNDRIDAGLTWFGPKRGAEIVGNGFGANGNYDGSDKKNFFIPEFGIVKRVSPSLTAGVAVYGNGGMNTDYGRNPFAAFGSTGSAGVDLAQLFISPSLAWKANDSHAFGVAVNFAYQRFAAKGLSAFAGSSQDGGNLTDRGHDSSTGWGARIGWTGRVTQNLTLGATWASKTRTGAFDKYKGLFAEQGGFDIPANYGIGVAWRVTPSATIVADVQRIEYSGIASVGNPLAQLLAGNPLGSANGPGFGWRDISVGKLGISYELNRDLTLRAGLSHASQPIPADQTFLNILAPGVVQDHLSLGATWKQGKDELSVAFTHAFRKTVSGSNSIPAPFGGGNANTRLEENVLGIAYAWTL